MGYGNQWRNGRRLLHDFLNARAVVKFDQYQHKHVNHLLLYLAESPEDFLDHIKLWVFHKGLLAVDFTHRIFCKCGCSTPYGYDVWDKRHE